MKNNTKRAIMVRVGYLEDMASLEDLSINALLLEMSDLDNQIQTLKTDIENSTPNEADYNEAKSPYQVSLAARRAELNRYQVRLDEINSKLEEEKSELNRVILEEQKLIEEKDKIDKFVVVLDGYKKRRELKSYAESNVEEKDNIYAKLEETKNSKVRIQNSINLLIEDKDDILESINNCEEEIERLELTLASNKELEDAPSIKQKKDRLASDKQELAKLEARKKEIIESPEYLAYEIGELLDAKADYNLIKSKVIELYDLVRSKPFMSIVIRNGEVKPLQEKYADLEQSMKDLKNAISKESYVLKSLPSEDSRLSDLEKLINSKNNQIGVLKELIESNNNVILILLRQHRDLQAEYNKEMSASLDYLEQSAKLDKITRSKMKADYTQHQNTLAEQKEIIGNYPVDVEAIIQTNRELQNLISKYEEEIENYKQEMKSLMAHKKARKPIKNYILRASHEKKLQLLKDEKVYLSKRLKYQNYTPTQLKNDIFDGLKIMYADELKQEKKAPKKEEVKAPLESQTIEVTPLEKVAPVKEEALAKEEVPTKEEIKTEVDSFDVIGDLLNKIDLQNNKKTQEKEEVEEKPIDLDINMEETVAKVQAKKGEKEPVMVSTKNIGVDLSNDLETLNQKAQEEASEKLEITNKEPEKEIDKLIFAPIEKQEEKKEAPKYKVVGIVPLVANSNVEAKQTESPKYKVVGVEPIKKDTNNFNQDQIYDGLNKNQQY